MVDGSPRNNNTYNILLCCLLHRLLLGADEFSNANRCGSPCCSDAASNGPSAIPAGRCTALEVLKASFVLFSENEKEIEIQTFFILITN